MALPARSRPRPRSKRSRGAVIDAGRPFAVTDEQGALIGQLEPRAVLDVSGRAAGGRPPWLGRSPRRQELAAPGFGGPKRARAVARAAGAHRPHDPGGRGDALGVQVSRRLGGAAQELDQRPDDVAARRCQLRPVHLSAADPGDLLADRAAVPPGREPAVRRLRRGRRSGCGRALAAASRGSR